MQHLDLLDLQANKLTNILLYIDIYLKNQYVSISQEDVDLQQVTKLKSSWVQPKLTI